MSKVAGFGACCDGDGVAIVANQHLRLVVAIHIAVTIGIGGFASLTHVTPTQQRGLAEFLEQCAQRVTGFEHLDQLFDGHTADFFFTIVFAITGLASGFSGGLGSRFGIAITLAVIISVVNEGSATESFSLLMMGMTLAAIVPPFVAVFYVWLRHRTVTQKFLWLYAALTFAMLLVAKIVATSVSVASGVPGGIFTPVLLVGGATGMLWAHAVNSFVGGTPMNPGGCALIGMAATTAANIHAPLTSAVLVFELSGDYPIVVPLLLATVVSTALSRGLGSESVYAAELRRRGLRMELTLDGRQTDRL